MAKRRILIVGDQNAGRGSLEARLIRLGYQVAAIAPRAGEVIGGAGLAAAADLALLDLSRGAEGDGVAFAEQIRRELNIPVLRMTPEPSGAGAPGPGLPEREGYVSTSSTDRELRASVELALCRHEAARAVDEMEERFFTASIDLLCFLDFNGHFKRLNPAWERALGFTRQELMSRPFIEFVHPDDRKRTLAQNAAVRDGGQALSFENRYLCKDGSYRWLRWNATPDPSQRVIYSVARDITESKRADEEREKLVRQLRAALAEVASLREILPICSYCRKVRDDENYWHTVESYISRHTSKRFSHGICPSCLATEMEGVDELETH